MVDRIQKSLDRFSEKEKRVVKYLLQKIKANEVGGLNIKKLKGYNNIFRVRKGKIRIIYRVDKGNIFILTIEKRSDKTYNI